MDNKKIAELGSPPKGVGEPGARNYLQKCKCFAYAESREPARSLREEIIMQDTEINVPVKDISIVSG